MWPHLSLACYLHKFSRLYLPQFATYTMHVDTLLSSMPPMQFPWDFCREHLCRVFFRYQVAFPVIFVQPGSDFHCCIDSCQRSLQAYIQHWELTSDMIFTKFLRCLLKGHLHFYLLSQGIKINWVLLDGIKNFLLGWRSDLWMLKSWINILGFLA